MFDPSVLARPVLTTETRVFSDPYQPGTKLALDFAPAPDYTTRMRLQKQSVAFEKQFCGVTPPSPITLGSDGTRLEISPELCMTIAVIQAVHKPASPDGWLTFELWAMTSVVMPVAFSEIAEWAMSLVAPPNSAGDEEPAVPNDSAEVSANPAALPPSTT